MRTHSRMIAPYLKFNCTSNVFDVLVRKADIFAPTLQGYALEEAPGSVSMVEKRQLRCGSDQQPSISQEYVSLISIWRTLTVP